MNRKLLYIDIDGVLLGKEDPDSIRSVMARHAREFLEFCLAHYDCYWLTTHCMEGSPLPAVDWLRKYADDDVVRLACNIQPTIWKTLKTEAIDFSSDFYWVDDEPIQIEIETLKKNNAFHRWIQVDTYRNPDDLKRAINTLKGYAHAKDTRDRKIRA